MNARQTKKCLKKQIAKLQSDNNLMHNIIADNSGMQELYDLYNKPLNVQHTTIPFQEFKAKRVIPGCTGNIYQYEENIEQTKQAAAKDLFESIKEHIIYDIDAEYMMPTTITASIIIGRK